jgi:hypothetical protein
MDEGWLDHGELESYCSAVRDSDNVSAINPERSEQVTAVGSVTSDRSRSLRWTASPIPPSVIENYLTGVSETWLIRQRQELVGGEGGLDQDDWFALADDRHLEIDVTK